MFPSAPRGQFVPEANTTNAAGGVAYKLSNEAALLQIAMTGTFNDTYYIGARAQFEKVRELAHLVEPTFLAQVAIYAHEQGGMKDMPAFLLAVLASRVHQGSLVAHVFKRVITNGKMLRNFVQFIRSGVTGRKSFGTRLKRLIQNWLNEQSVHKLLRASIGNDPSLTDIIKMVHPKPQDDAHKAFYAWLVKGEVQETLDANIKAYTAFREELVRLTSTHKAAVEANDPLSFGSHPWTPAIDALPNVPMEMLLSLPLLPHHWVALANQMTWTQLRMNLNTLARNGVFANREVVDVVAQRLADPVAIAASKAFPYQLLSTYLNIDGLPEELKMALNLAMGPALKNVQPLPGKVILCPDVSGSMNDPVTGTRKGATSKTRNVDVAGLITAAYYAVNQDLLVMPFNTEPLPFSRLGIGPDSTVLENARALGRMGGGGTDCSASLRMLLGIARQNTTEQMVADLKTISVIFVISDNESWGKIGQYRNTRPAMLQVWRELKAKHCPNAKLICLDISPNPTVQVPDEPDVINIGGFSDEVFRLVHDFVTGTGLKAQVDKVKAIELV